MSALCCGWTICDFLGKSGKSRVKGEAQSHVWLLFPWLCVKYHMRPRVLAQENLNKGTELARQVKAV